MFLVRGPIHHDRTWAAWLDDAAGLVPTPAAVTACCGADDGSGSSLWRNLPGSHSSAAGRQSLAAVSASSVRPPQTAAADAQTVPADEAEAEAAAHAAVRRLRQRQSRQRRRGRSLHWGPLLPRATQQRQRVPNEGIVAAQRLFSVYVHPAPRYAAYPEGHLFHGLELQDRVKVVWGHHSVTRAMRLLLAAAVADPGNQRFMFLDETSIPLYPPHLVWVQFMHETKTRMSACETQVSSIYWEPQFEGPVLKRHMWRKSSQWSMIQRHHAEVLVADTAVWDVVTPACDARKIVDPVTNTSKPYPCVSDEHYYPTVLAANGFSNETTCAGNAMHVDWLRAPGNGSPFTYWMKDTSLDTINQVRGQKGRCPYMDAIRDANQPGNFETPASLRRFRCPATEAAAEYQMPYSDRVDGMVQCSMFSRKWGPSTHNLVFEALTNATHPSGVLADWRGRARAQQEAEEAARAARAAARRAALPGWLRQLPCMASGGCS